MLKLTNKIKQAIGCASTHNPPPVIARNEAISARQADNIAYLSCRDCFVPRNDMEGYYKTKKPHKAAFNIYKRLSES